MRERYGSVTAQQLADIFALGSSQLTGPQKAERFIEHQTAIFRRAAREGGPCVVSAQR